GRREWSICFSWIVFESTSEIVQIRKLLFDDGGFNKKKLLASNCKLQGTKKVEVCTCTRRFIFGTSSFMPCICLQLVARSSQPSRYLCRYAKNKHPHDRDL